MPQIPRTITTSGLLSLLFACFFALPACGPRLESIDQRVESMLRQRQEALGSPARPEPDAPPPAEPPRAAYDYSPESANPPARSLTIPRSGELTVDELTERLEAQYVRPEESRVLDLEESFRIAMSSGREYLTAQEEYIIAAIRLLIEQHRWGPRFFADIVGSLDSTPSDSGGYDTALGIISSFRATQRLPYGGDVEARAVHSLAQDLRDAASDEYRQSTEIVLSAEVPLLRGAGQVAREDLIQAERDLVYAARDFERFRRRYFVEIAVDYFSLLAAKASIRNQESQLESLNLQLEITQEKKDMGLQSQADVDNVQRNVLSAEDRLLGLRENYMLALDRFKLRLGLDLDEPIEIEDLDIVMGVPEVTPESAARTAMLFRLDLQNRRDRLLDSTRGVKIAANQLLPDLNLSGGVTFPTDEDDDAIDSFALDQALYSAGVTFSLPIDREIERANLRQQTIRLAQTERDLREQEDDIIIEARRAVRALDRARLSIELQESNIAITRRRLEILEIEQGELQLKLDAELDLLEARDARDEAIRSLRSNILAYLLATGQMRVTEEGLFQPVGDIALLTTEKADPEAGMEADVLEIDESATPPPDPFEEPGPDSATEEEPDTEPDQVAPAR
jgi:outer membrane protein TolC